MMMGGGGMWSVVIMVSKLWDRNAMKKCFISTLHPSIHPSSVSDGYYLLPTYLLQGNEKRERKEFRTLVFIPFFLPPFLFFFLFSFYYAM
jgi:hypothetical protein